MSNDINAIIDNRPIEAIIDNKSIQATIDNREIKATIDQQSIQATIDNREIKATIEGVIVNLPGGFTDVVVVNVRNTTNETLLKGTAVYINGATGQISTVAKAIATSDATSAQTLGLINADLPKNTNGQATIIGLVDDINTSAYTDGQQLYLSPTIAGGLTATKPYAPDHLVYIGIVEYAHPVHGKIFVKVQNGYELDELHDVSARNPSNNDFIKYNSTSGLWDKTQLKTINNQSILGSGNITISGGSVAETFNTVSKNLNSWNEIWSLTNGYINSKIYTNGTNTITKTINWNNGLITSIVLSGDTPTGIDLIKTFDYTNTNSVEITYS